LTDRHDPLVSAIDFIEHGGLEEKVATLRSQWFAGYERRPEVIRALERFLSQRGLSE